MNNPGLLVAYRQQIKVEINENTRADQGGNENNLKTENTHGLSRESNIYKGTPTPVSRI